MDRSDARFAADALEARLEGRAPELALLAANSFVRLMGVAQALRRNAGAWAPALVGAERLEAICATGQAAVDLPASSDEKIIVDKLRALADEPARPRNRHDRRKAAKVHLPRPKRLAGRQAPLTLH